jgi:hypothetical protein
MTTVNVTTTTNTVDVTTETGTIVVQVPVTSTVTATAVGPQGPPGGAAFVYLQAAAATVWTINHNLGYRPSVELLDTGSQEIDGDVAHPSINQTVVTLNPASAGLARLI